MKITNIPKYCKILMSVTITPTKETLIDYREIICMLGGFMMALAFLVKGDFDTAKTITSILLGYGIGRVIP